MVKNAKYFVKKVKNFFSPILSFVIVGTNQQPNNITVMKFPKLWLIVFSLTFITTLLNFSAFAQTGQSLSFDGVNDYVDLPAFDFYTSEFTIEGWVKPNNFTGAGAIITGLNNNDDAGFDVQFLNIDGIRFIYRNPPAKAGGQFIVDVNTPLLGVWTHFAAVYGADQKLRLYLNGNLVGVSAGSISPLPSGALTTIRLGYNWSGATRWLDGYMDEIRIWDYARTQAEINADKDCELQGTEAGLLVYYNFNQGVAGGNNASETTLNDLAGAAQNATLNNFALNGSVSNWVDDAPTLNCPAPDTDNDGIPDNTDPDDDNDGCLDADDSDPLVAGTDTDSDGIADECDDDDDNDGCLDGVDSDPLVPGTDTDSDGTADECDPDDDNDGCVDGSDPAPLDASITCPSTPSGTFILTDINGNPSAITLSNGGTVCASVLNAIAPGTSNKPQFAITADFGDPAVESVRFGFQAPGDPAINANYRTESSAPYALHGDVRGNFNPYTYVAGTYTVRARGYSQSRAQGTVLYDETFTFTIDGTCRLSEITSKWNMSIYPNPAQNKFNLNLENLGSGKVQIGLYNTSGALVRAESIEATSGSLTHAINIQDLPNGLYIVKVSNDQQTITGKVMKF
jgi:hypothetical protein